MGDTPLSVGQRECRGDLSVRALDGAGMAWPDRSALFVVKRPLSNRDAVSGTTRLVGRTRTAGAGGRDAKRFLGSRTRAWAGCRVSGGNSSRRWPLASRAGRWPLRFTPLACGVCLACRDPPVFAAVTGYQFGARPGKNTNGKSYTTIFNTAVPPSVRPRTRGVLSSFGGCAKSQLRQLFLHSAQSGRFAEPVRGSPAGGSKRK